MEVIFATDGRVPNITTSNDRNYFHIIQLYDRDDRCRDCYYSKIMERNEIFKIFWIYD